MSFCRRMAAKFFYFMPRKANSAYLKKTTTLTVILFLVYLLFIYSNQPRLIKVDNLKVIQLYTGVFDWKNWDQPGLGQIPFKNCPENRCYAVRPYVTQTAMPEADGVMVHGPNLWYLPSRNSYKRSQKQIWLYYALESPRGSMCSSHYSPNDLDDWFNLTVTYKRDSDFVADYSPVNQVEDMERSESYLYGYSKLSVKSPKLTLQSVWPDYILAPKKRKSPIVWFVSHCETASRRENYIKELRKHIDIDIYGKCSNYFTNSLPDPCPKGSPEDCFNKVINSYKFYLSFENSLCDDYISEKFWKFFAVRSIFDVSLVPVVRGATEEQFKKVTFRNSYLNAYNFESPKDLGAYLNYLNGNNTAYLEYFEWKRDLFNKLDKNLNKGFVGKGSGGEFLFLKDKKKSPFCYLCEQLHNMTYMNSNTNRVWKLSEWFGWKTSCWDVDEERRIPFWFTQFFGFCF